MTNGLCSLISHQANIRYDRLKCSATSIIVIELKPGVNIAREAQTLVSTAHPETSTSRKFIGIAAMDRWG